MSQFGCQGNFFPLLIISSFIRIEARVFNGLSCSHLPQLTILSFIGSITSHAFRIIRSPFKSNDLTPSVLLVTFSPSSKLLMVMCLTQRFSSLFVHQESITFDLKALLECGFNCFLSQLIFTAWYVINTSTLTFSSFIYNHIAWTTGLIISKRSSHPEVIKLWLDKIPFLKVFVVLQLASYFFPNNMVVGSSLNSLYLILHFTQTIASMLQSRMNTISVLMYVL